MDPRVAEALQQAHDLVAEMIKQSANEPSLGLYFVQQHVHKAVPAIISLKEQVLEGAHEAELGKDDARDALAAVRVMKQVGPPVIERMIQHLNSAAQALHPSRRASEHTNYAKAIWDNAVDKASNITRRSSSIDIQKPEEEASPAGADAPASNSSPYGYVRSVLESATQRVGSLGWGDSPAAPAPAPKPDDEDASSDSTKNSGDSGKSSSLLEAVQAKPARYVRAVIDTALMRRKESTAAAPATSTPEEEDDPAEKVIVRLESEESFDKFQAENAAKLAQWLEQP